MQVRYQSFLLILASALLILIIYTTLLGTGGVRSLWDSEINVIATGDIMLGRTVMTKSLDMKDPAFPFRKVSERLKSADLAFANLENPIVQNCPRHTDGLVFCADPKMVEGLVYAGVDVVTIANNHILNYGQSGKEETIKILNQNGIAVTGNDNLVVKEVNGTRFGFLGFNFVDKTNASESDLKLVRDSDSRVDVLIVGVHWGNEYRDQANSFQKNIAQKLVASGGDIVIGHHPHWVQDSETVNGKPIYYSLGNFVFDQMWSTKTREGIAVNLVFNREKLVKEEKLPIYMQSWAQPEWR